MPRLLESTRCHCSKMHKSRFGFKEHMFSNTVFWPGIHGQPSGPPQILATSCKTVNKVHRSDIITDNHNSVSWLLLDLIGYVQPKIAPQDQYLNMSTHRKQSDLWWDEVSTHHVLFLFQGICKSTPFGKWKRH